jgi:hypothetical protein
MGRPYRDLAGKTFGRLTVTQDVKPRKGARYWRCQCSCGEWAWVLASNLAANRQTKSCGCLRTERGNVLSFKDGHSTKERLSPTYYSWKSMLERCRNPNGPDAHLYAHRGINVCKRWEDFENFLQDMGERPLGKSLDRIENKKGYEPGNCRWATPCEQGRNRSDTKLTFNIAVEIALLRLGGTSRRTIAKRYAVSEWTVRDISAGKTWRDATAEAAQLFNMIKDDKGAAMKSHGQIIYVPTEAGLPILEASRHLVPSTKP